MQWSSRLILLCWALAVSTNSREGLGATALDVLLFAVLAKLWNKSPRQIPVSPLLPIWHPDILVMVWKGGKNQAWTDLSPLKIWLNIVVQSGSLLYTKFSHSFTSNLRHIMNWVIWLTRKCGTDKYICNLICLAVYSKRCNNIALSCII